MKWKDKGHEFDKEWENIRDKFIGIHTIYLFGAGERGKYWLNTFKHVFQNSIEYYFIDNDITKIGRRIDDVEVLPFKHISMFFDRVIFITTSNDYEDEIKKQLLDAGFEENVHFFLNPNFSRYISLTLLYSRNFLMEKYVQISIVETCTLKCKFCAHSSPYIKKECKKFLSYNEAKESIDYYFKVVDYVGTFDVLGGEPLLSKYLPTLINYLSCTYRNKIGRITITTNGTLLPSPKLLDACKTADVTFLLSDYSESVPRVRGKVKKFKNLILKNDINLVSIYEKDGKWIDLGLQNINQTDEYAKRLFNLCPSDCREIRSNKYYYCIIARCASEFIYDNEDFANCLDINRLSGTMGKRIFYEFSNGYSENGYLNMCKHCRGLNANKNFWIKPGEQIDLNLSKRNVNI